MGLVDELPSGSRVALDSNVLIYFIEEHPTFGKVVDPLFQAIADGAHAAVVSVVSLLEVLVAPLRSGQSVLANRYRDLLTTSAGLNLTLVTGETAERAASLRAAHNLRVPDALIAATAATEGCSHLIASDSRFARAWSSERSSSQSLPERRRPT